MYSTISAHEIPSGSSSREKFAKLYEIAHRDLSSFQAVPLAHMINASCKLNSCVNPFVPSSVTVKSLAIFDKTGRFILSSSIGLGFIFSRSSIFFSI